MRGQHAQVRKLLAAFAAGGHVLVDDFPGTGKTTLAKSLAASIGARFARVQFTPDLLPSDILGVSVFNQRDQSFEFREGPVFTCILLADEINRASPRTQSALLEVMAEGQVSVEGRTRWMRCSSWWRRRTRWSSRHLPAASADGPLRAVPRARLRGRGHRGGGALGAGPRPSARCDPAWRPREVLALKDAARRVRVADEIRHYVVELVRRTRSAPQVLLGCGPRASIALTHTAKALALFDGEAYVRPEHVQELAVATLAHRMVLDPQARFAGVSAQALVADILREVKVPA
jgi:MoxR-like ATPase